MRLDSSVQELPFIIRRLLFPVRLAWAMSIHKAQGQTLQRCGVYLPDPAFTHGQLYVGASRSNAPSGIKFLLGQSEGHGYQDGQSNEYSGPFTHNIVYRSVLKQTSSDNTPVNPAEVTSVTSLSAQQKAVRVAGAEVQDAGCDYIDLSMTQESTLPKASAPTSSCLTHRPQADVLVNTVPPALKSRVG